MRRRHRGRLPILFADAFTMVSTRVTFGSIIVSKVLWHPLNAGQNLNLVFTISHKGQARNVFDFVFEISKSGLVLFQAKQSYFKVPDGLYEVNVTVPGKILKEGETLRFEVRCERTYSADAYVRYYSISFSQTPMKDGGRYKADEEIRYYNLQSLYYPSSTVFWNSSYFFFNTQKKREANSRRLHLEDVGFRVSNMKEYEAVNEQLGELRIFTKLNYWNVGERDFFGGKYITLPLGYTLDGETYRLRLLETYSFSEETGEMMELTDGYPRTNDLILPYWATESNPIKLQIALLNFNPAGQSLLIDKEAYYNGAGALGNYTIQWEGY